MIEVKDIAEYEENDSELAKYTISKLSSEKKELQQRIDKAIEYIEENKEKQFAYNYEYYLEDKEVESLLNILKGSE